MAIRNARAHPDFRELLARPDIDAVVIATGERWHPLIGIEAARRGKHIYCEKPLSVTLAEGLALRAAVQKYGVVFQWGTQQRSSVNYRLTAELVRNGYIGDVRNIMIGSAGGSPPKPEPPETLKDPPAGFDYDQWLGPSPYVPYSDVRVSLTWLFIRDYGLGCLGGAWGIHDLDAAQFFFDTDDTTPTEIEGRARYYEDIRDVPYSWTVEQKYASGPTVIHMDLVTAKKRAKQFELGGMASVVTGSKGWIWVSRQGVKTEPESLAQTVIGPNEKHVIFSDDHKQNFLDAIRKKGAADLADHGGRARGNDVPAIRHRDAAAAQAALGSEGRTIHRRRAGEPHALTRHSSALELHDMRISVFALTTAAAVILTAAGPHERATAAQTPAPAAQPQAPPAAGQAQEPRRRREVSPEERAKIEVALPAKAPATPRKSRKLLVFDRQGIYNGKPYGGHASIPHANLAVQLMGEKTGAFTATLASEPGAISAANLQQYDAVYLNNTVGDIFDTPEMRAAFVAFVARGGGVIGNHGTSVASPQWTEFGEILGATGASHREPTEKATVIVEDPTHPVTRAFDGKPFEYVDEFYRLAAPYSRDKVRVLLSIDPLATDMMQGRCAGQCLRDDNDYPVAWIRQHGKARVFYTSLGHNPDPFWDPRMLAMFLAGTQYALGDLEADATPRPRGSTQFDMALAAMTSYDFGQDRAQVRRFEREVSLAAATKAGAADAEQKMLKVLQSQAPLGAKDAICRQLAIIGSSRSEPVLTAMLKNKNTEAMARYALHGLQTK